MAAMVKQGSQTQQRVAKSILMDDLLKDLEATARYQLTDEGAQNLDMRDLMEQHQGRLSDWWYQSRVHHAMNRAEMAMDEDFIDGIQWTDEDKQVVEDRGQAPLVFNEIKPTHEWLCGTERRTRIDWKVHPRDDSDIERVTAEHKTKLLKYLSDVNRAPWHRSAAFREAVGAGLGWLEVGIRGNSDREMLFLRSESWRNMWLDPISREPDITDARFLNRARVVDVDIAVRMFPWAELIIRRAAATMEQIAAQASDQYFESQLYYSAESASFPVTVADALQATGNRRLVVPLVETWYKVPASVIIARGAPRFDGLEYDEEADQMRMAREAGDIILFDAVRMKMRCAIQIEAGQLLQDLPSPYRHNRFPFIPVWGYRRKRDGQPYGPVRNQRDPQEDLNKRRSKALFILSTNQVVMDEDAVDEEEHGDVRTEVADPQGVIKKKRNAHFEIINGDGLAAEHVNLGIQDAEYIRQSGGVTGENLGLESNATSGKAITARQNQGTVVTTPLFDNLRLATQIAGELQLVNIEQFMSFEKVIRVVGDRGHGDYVTINKRDPETGEIVNPITESQADFIVEETPFHESVRLAMFEQLAEMVRLQPPEVAIQLLDMVFDMSDLPGKDAFVARIRQINGQSDPDEPETPEAAAEREEKEAQAKQEAEMAMRGAIAELRKLEAEAMESEASAQKAQAESGKTVAERQSVALDNLIKAFEIALSNLQAPNVAPVADQLLAETGA